ncbi:rod shape-determining protein [Fructobacillus papyrifericola]|uniref:Cell shape-determining protein MreB n=1 Tax=Fructobacillus papyrifericola TaxID=2713172 RepID=A0ABS5QSV1_9LACO|nr:rod shape-determining protein [Fructobacillus papyrifericola]
MALSFGQHNVGIDLGTSNTYVYVEGKGIVLREPSVVARNTETNEIIAVGEEARAMLGRTPASIAAIRPMRDGVIADYDTTVAMISYYLKKALGGRVGKPFVTLGVPAKITAVERRAVIDAARVAGARDAYVLEEPFAAAIGAGLPVMEPTGSMVVDFGGGTTDVATISLGGIVSSRSTRFAGDKLNEAIISFVRNNYNLAIGETTAERLKIEVGTVSLQDAKEIPASEARGRDLLTGLPKTIEVQAIDVAQAIQDPVNEVVNAIRETLESTQPEIAADVIDHGMVLTGGGAQLRGLPEMIESVTKVSVIVAEDPMDAVVKGVGESLKSLEILRRN